VTISAELQQRYSSEVDFDWFEALILSHSTAGALYLAKAEDGENRIGTIDGVDQTFLAIPFEVVLPRKDGEGQQDMTVRIGNVGEEMTHALDAAVALPHEPIRCRYTVFIEGNKTPQINPPLELSLTDISLTQELMTATATRYNVFNRPFPSVVYRNTEFPGLKRR
jgi:hypothetical protein